MSEEEISCTYREQTIIKQEDLLEALQTSVEETCYLLSCLKRVKNNRNEGICMTANPISNSLSIMLPGTYEIAPSYEATGEAKHPFFNQLFSKLAIACFQDPRVFKPHDRSEDAEISGSMKLKQRYPLSLQEANFNYSYPNSTLRTPSRSAIQVAGDDDNNSSDDDDEEEEN